MGPYTGEQLDRILGPIWVGNKRFGIRQGSKIRPIDDLTDSGLNSCVSVLDKVDVFDIDSLVNVVKLWSRCLRSEGAFAMELSTGERLEGCLHDGFKKEQKLLKGVVRPPLANIRDLQNHPR